MIQEALVVSFNDDQINLVWPDQLNPNSVKKKRISRSRDYQIVEGPTKQEDLEMLNNQGKNSLIRFTSSYLWTALKVNCLVALFAVFAKAVKYNYDNKCGNVEKKGFIFNSYEPRCSTFLNVSF